MWCATCACLVQNAPAMWHRRGGSVFVVGLYDGAGLAVVGVVVAGVGHGLAFGFGCVMGEVSRVERSRAWRGWGWRWGRAGVRLVCGGGFVVGGGAVLSAGGRVVFVGVRGGVFGGGGGCVSDGLSKLDKLDKLDSAEVCLARVKGAPFVSLA